MRALTAALCSTLLVGCAGTARVGDSLEARAGSTAAQIDGAFCGAAEPIRLDIANATDHVLTGSYAVTTPDGRKCEISLSIESTATAAQAATYDAVLGLVQALVPLVPRPVP